MIAIRLTKEVATTAVNIKNIAQQNLAMQELLRNMQGQ